MDPENGGPNVHAEKYTTEKTGLENERPNKDRLHIIKINERTESLL